jgi:hypothetical protein
MTSSAGACRPKVSTVDHSSPALVGGDVPNQARPIVVRSRAATATSNLAPAAACKQSYLALDPDAGREWEERHEEGGRYVSGASYYW